MFALNSHFKFGFSYRIVHFFFALILLSACGSPYSESIDRGDSYMLRDGYPEFSFTAQPERVRDSLINLSVLADIVQGSLIYTNNDSLADASANDLNKNALTARFSLSAQLFPTQKMENLLTSTQETYSLQAESQSVTESQRTAQFRIILQDVDSGRFWLRVVTTDHISEKSTARTIPVTVKKVPSASDKPVLTSVLMHGKESDNSYQPLATYTTPARFDSLRFDTEIWGNPLEKVVLEIKLTQFRSDTKPARDLSGRDYSPSSIRYQGIDLDKESRILRDRITVQPGDQSAKKVSYDLKRPNIGNYRLSISIVDDDEGLISTEKRDFGVKSPWFPALRTMRELAAPLIYLMNKKDHDNMMKINDPDELKAAYDRFWIDNIGDPAIARDVVQKFNERVLEANKQFTNYKEGWKTDMGMIYILFGPPWYVESRVDKMKWSYAYDRDDIRYNFVFDRYKYKNKHYPFYNYRLLRHRAYFNVGFRQRELWLNGTILQREI